MEDLVYYNQVLQKNVSSTFKRFLFEEIDWEQRMIAITGARGVGKTTMMLQRQKEMSGIGEYSIYVSMEHPHFYNHTLFDLADKAYKMGIRQIYVDEVHKYTAWSRELKVIYDMFPDMQIVFSASSALNIYRGEADLSRRVVTYPLPGLSFREYLKMKGLLDFPKLSLNQITQNHTSLAQEIDQGEKFHILPEFNQYLKSGYYPFMVHLKEADYTVRLNQVVNTVLDMDMAYAEGYTPSTALRIKKLLAVLAESVPFQPNVAELARKLGISRDTIYQYLNHLEQGSLVLSLHAHGKGVSVLQKPEKLFLENTNLAYAMSPRPDKGSLRETFIMNQLSHSGWKPTAPKTGDFYVNDITIEVGGKQKSKNQIKEIENAYIAADDILVGFGQKVPLWMFGFGY